MSLVKMWEGNLSGYRTLVGQPCIFTARKGHAGLLIRINDHEHGQVEELKILVEFNITFA